MTPTTRHWTVAALLLLALLPADLAVARLALRHDLTASTAGAVRGGARTVSHAGADLAADGIHALGAALVDGACWVADLAAGPPRERMGYALLPAARLEALACRGAGCDGGPCPLRQAELARALERCALERDAALRMRARMTEDRTRARIERIEARIARERHLTRHVMVLEVRGGAGEPLPPAPRVVGAPAGS